MNKPYEKLIKSYFAGDSLVKSDIDSFNHFIEVELQRIIDENKEIEPTIIPHNIEEFKIRLDKIWIKKPEIIEADGSRKDIYPIEARLRKISYSAPIYIEVSAHIDGIQRESFTTQIGSIPIMLKSNFCHIAKLSRDQLIEKGEDPDDPGGYFIVNGTEKVLVSVEDLAPNTMLVEKASTGVSEFVGKLFSEQGSYKIPHTFEKMKDGIFYLSFTRVRRIPLVIILKALGMTKDEDIMKAIGIDDTLQDDVFVNLYEFVNMKDTSEALDHVAKKIGITQAKDIRIERMTEILDRYLLPHIGTSSEDRMAKAMNLCKLLKKYILVSKEVIAVDDKDHFMNKRIKLSGDLLADLLRMNLNVLIGDMLYNFQRIVKRGKFPSIKVVIRDKLLTSRIYSSMATGNWVGERKGISQRMERTNFMATCSHLQRVTSPLSTSQENFEARALHATHLGRLCPVETPEGTNIGLKKNLALLTTITKETPEDDVLKKMKDLGMKKATYG